MWVPESIARHLVGEVTSPAALLAGRATEIKPPALHFAMQDADVAVFGVAVRDVGVHHERGNQQGHGTTGRGSAGVMQGRETPRFGSQVRPSVRHG